MKNIHFTIDVEEWFHAENLRPYIKKIDKSFKTLHYCEDILNFLDERSIKGTFFILATVAKENQALVKKIYDSGHEIASHGYDHKLIHNFNENEMHEDINKSTNILEDIISDKVVGYRSPCFSQNIYLNDALVKNGFLYTSMSIQSSFHDRYANNVYASKDIRDFSLPVANFGPLKILSTGGGWFRLFPLNLQKYLIEKTEIDPVIFYCHPWDFGNNIPKHFNEVPFLKKFRHTINTDSALKKLEKLNFKSCTIKESL